MYVTTKHGVMGLTKSLALAYADQTIRANALCPVPIDTSLLWSGLEPDSDCEEFVHHRVANCPTPKMAAPEEVASADLFLVSDDSSIVNGVGLAVDDAK